MRQKPENEELLNDVFSQASCEELRDAMFGETLRLVRRRRRWRQTRGAAAAVMTVLISALIWEVSSHRSVSSRPTATQVERAYALVRSQPLPAAAFVETARLPAGLVVASSPVEIVRTTANNYRPIDDKQLLALLAPKSAALIRDGPNSEKLIFVNPAEANQ